MDNILPLFGAFSVFFFLILGAFWLAWLVLWILVPFTLFAIRKQVDQQAIAIQRIEKQLAELVEIARTVRPSPPAPVAPVVDPMARYQPPGGI